MKRYINVYKNLLIFSLIICTSHTMQADEKSPGENSKEEIETIQDQELLEIENEDDPLFRMQINELAVFCDRLAKKIINNIVGSNSLSISF